MSREDESPLSVMVRLLWLLLSHRHASLRIGRLSPLVKKALSYYKRWLTSLGTSTQCMGYNQLVERRLLKEKYCQYGILMAAATSLPVLYKKVEQQHMVKAVCAKASVSTSAKLLDNLNDTIHSRPEAVHSLSAYESALKRGHYTADGDSPTAQAEHSAHQIATWVSTTVPSLAEKTSYSQDVSRLVKGQMASLQHKKGKYPDMKEYLSNICERSIGNTWIDVDLSLIEEDETQLKKGNNYIFKSYLIYDDVQDIKEDLRTNSVNSAVILGLERGLFTESDLHEKQDVFCCLAESGIFQDLLCLGDVVFSKGLDIITQCDSSIDTQGLAASLGFIRMFNLRRTLKREKTLTVLSRFLATHRSLKSVHCEASPHIQNLADYIG